MDTNRKRRTNKRWPEALKRKIVAASFAAGGSVSSVARLYDVNANQVFAWRRRFGPPIAPIPATSPRPRLVEVMLATPTEPPPTPAARIGDDLIEIEVGDHYRVRVGADFDAHALRRLLDVLVNR